MRLYEFAPPGGDDREPNEEEILRQLAAQWWNGTEQQMAKAQNTLAAMGWEIGQDESGDDDAGVFVVRAGDEHGNSYMAFNHSDLNLNEGSELKQAKRKYNQAAKDANADQVGAGKKIDTMKNSLRQRDLNKQGMAEGEQQKGADYRKPKEAEYGPEYDDMVARVKKLAGLGPMKTVYDPNKRVYRNIPTAVQPKK
jgi:hypothetical protein